MDLLEVKKLYEDNVRVLVQNMNEILKLQIVHVYDDVMQDHLADTRHSMDFINEETPVEELLELLVRFNKGMKDIYEQLKWNDEHFRWNECEERLISEMLVGRINGRLTDELADCARQVKKLADELLSKASRVRTDKEYMQLLNRFINGVIEYAKAADIYVDKEMPFLYLQFWFKRKYFEH